MVKKDEGISSTKIFLNNYFTEFKKDCPLELDVIAKKIIEHCLLYFISEHCPKIILMDEQSNSINLNDYFTKNNALFGRGRYFFMVNANISNKIIIKVIM